MALTKEEAKKLKLGDKLIYEVRGVKCEVKYVSPTPEPEIDGEDVFIAKIKRFVKHDEDVDFDHVVGDFIYVLPEEVSLP